MVYRSFLNAHQLISNICTQLFKIILCKALTTNKALSSVCWDLLDGKGHWRGGENEAISKTNYAHTWRISQIQRQRDKWKLKHNTSGMRAALVCHSQVCSSEGRGAIGDPLSSPHWLSTAPVGASQGEPASPGHLLGEHYCREHQILHLLVEISLCVHVCVQIYMPLICCGVLRDVGIHFMVIGKAPNAF